jgi:asparagine N-glycosylation enzyme membrane subunit Stt3
MKWIAPTILSLSIGLAILFRVVLPWAQVFGGSVLLNTPDAYIMVRYADCWPDIPSYDYFMDFPQGSNVLITVWPSAIAMFARIIGVSNMISAAVLPPILFLFTLIPVYIIGRTLFNKWVGVGAVAIFCLLPGEILNRTMLGAADYHAWEIFLVSNIMMLVIIAAENYKRPIDLFFYSVGAIGLWVLYWYSWVGSVWLLFVLGVCLTIWVVLNTRKPVLLGMYMLGGLGMLAGALLISPERTKFYALQFLNIFTVNLSNVVTEEFPVFFSYGKFDLNTIWLYFGITFYIVLIGLGWLVYRYLKERKPVDLVFLIWTIVSLAMMIARRRFDYYFAINAAIITSFVLVSVAQYLSINKATIVKIGVVVALAVCLPLIRADIYISTADTYMPKDWQNATQYLKEESDYKTYVKGGEYKFGVFSWWDYGYWIIKESHLPTYCQGSERDLEGSILVSTEPEKAVASLRALKMRFVVVDTDMLKDKWYPISKGRVVEKEKTLVYKLCNSEAVEGFKMVYESGQVKVYEVK